MNLSMKISLKYVILLFVMVLATRENKLLAQFISTFPEAWDSSRSLRGTKGQILIWTQIVDPSRNFEMKSCIKLDISKDSTGKNIYTISSMYTNERPYNIWNYQMIHWGPTPPSNCGYIDLHIENFDHQPTQKEIDSLFDRWMFKTTILNKNYGIDEKLWLFHFGFIPNLK